MPARLEVCVDTFEGLMAAVDGGADRVELCSSLAEGGLTPSAGLICAAAQIDIPCYAMIRPRAGHFRYSAHEVDIMLHDISVVRQAGLAGVALGAETEDSRLALDVLGPLTRASAGLGMTLHRVIDCLDDPMTAIDQARDLGFERVLTSGAAAAAETGAGLIAKMVRRADNCLSVMPGGGVTANNARAILDRTGAQELHASCRQAVRPARPHHFEPTPKLVTSKRMVRALKRVMSSTDQR